MDTLKRSTFALAINTFWCFVFIYEENNCMKKIGANMVRGRRIKFI